MLADDNAFAAIDPNACGVAIDPDDHTSDVAVFPPVSVTDHLDARAERLVLSSVAHRSGTSKTYFPPRYCSARRIRIFG